MREILRPMLASLIEAPLDDRDFVYEPKYDGIRAIVEVAPRGPVHLWSRLGNEKTAQFPEVTAALSEWARRLDAPVVLDGEIVALDAHGTPTGFQQLQGRIHLTTEPAGGSAGPRIAFIAFDILRDGSTDLRGRPLLERRAELERVFSKTGSTVLRISDVVRGDGRALYQQALESGWEGLIAKQATSVYKSGKRTPDWRKVKIVHEQEFVVGGWTEPRASRDYFGALLLGVYPESPAKKLIYAGHTGTGFNEPELARVMKRLRPLETTECPFVSRPKTNERPHWVKPALVAQVKFTEWTADDKLRHPVYLGLRDDKRPEDVHREESRRLRAHAKRPPRSRPSARPEVPEVSASSVTSLLDQLRAIEDAHRDARLTIPGSAPLSVSNLHKVFWPKLKLTKGDLMRYYVEVASAVLPAVDGRPLVMKRYPNGIASKPFYQHRAPDSVPDGVRVQKVKDDEVPSRIIGGSLTTLLYMAQLAAISMDPWFSRVESSDAADYVALDLDPSPGVSFARVLEVAKWIHDELEWLGAIGVPKTSGSEGLHIYIPLPPETPYDAGLLFCQIIATVVAQKHPKAATVERAVRARGRRVYVDYLQNIRGKTLATAYSARASDYAGASTPLSWREVHDGVRREDFTITTLPERLKAVGDLWKPLRESKGIDLSRASRYSRK